MSFTINELIDGKLDSAMNRTSDNKDKKKVVSLVAYLLGVKKEHFTDDGIGYEAAQYKELEKHSQARLIRCLCRVRADLMKNYSAINKKQAAQYPLSLSVLHTPEYVDRESLDYIMNDPGIKKDGNFYNYCQKPKKLLAYVNTQVNKRINNCRTLFPEWLKWAYIINIFTMPDGGKEDGIKTAMETYRKSYRKYPFQLYMNWKFKDDTDEFILANDERFVSLLYQQNGDDFYDKSKISDISQSTKNAIEDFILKAKKVTALVDCENSDPYAFCAMMDGLNDETIGKISKVILIDDKNTIAAWGMIDKYIPVRFEHVMVDRVLEQKSLVDMTLAVHACQEFYAENVDAFIIFASDSDYWALINKLDRAKFLVMAERGKCSSELKSRLSEKNVVYALIDKAYSAESTRMQYDILLRHILSHLKEQLNDNLKTLVSDKMKGERMQLSPDEKENFFNRYIRTLQFGIDQEGKINITAKSLLKD